MIKNVACEFDCTQKSCNFVGNIYFCEMFSLLFYIFLVVICTIFLVLSFVAWILFTPFDPARRIVHGLSRVLVRIFFLVPPFWRQRIEGLENIDSNKRYVMVINHNSMLDIPALYNVPLNFRWVSKREVFQIPFFGQFLMLHGDIAIERGNPAAAMKLVMERGVKWLSRGVSVSIFPEGTRSKTGEIGRFKSGGFRLAQEAGVEILPVVVNGTRRLLKSNGLLNPGHKIIIKVLPPVSRERVANTDMKQLMDEVRDEMVETLQQIRA